MIDAIKSERLAMPHCMLAFCLQSEFRLLQLMCFYAHLTDGFVFVITVNCLNENALDGISRYLEHKQREQCARYEAFYQECHVKY